jgi:hypothetical protein
VEQALAEYRDYLMTETLASEWQTSQAEPLYTEEKALDDENWRIQITKR